MPIEGAPRNFLLFFFRAEPVIIGFFNQAVIDISTDISDSVRLTILYALIFVAWIYLDSFMASLLRFMWYREQLYADRERHDVKNKPHRERKAFGNKSWHEVIFIVINALTLLLLYVLVQSLLNIIIDAWKSSDFGIFESLVGIFVILLGLYTIVQVLNEVSHLGEITSDSIEEDIDFPTDQVDV